MKYEITYWSTDGYDTIVIESISIQTALNEARYHQRDDEQLVGIFAIKHIESAP